MPLASSVTAVGAGAAPISAGSTREAHDRWSRPTRHTPWPRAAITSVRAGLRGDSKSSSSRLGAGRPAPRPAAASSGQPCAAGHPGRRRRRPACRRGDRGWPTDTPMRLATSRTGSLPSLIKARAAVMSPRLNADGRPPLRPRRRARPGRRRCARGSGPRSNSGNRPEYMEYEHAPRRGGINALGQPTSPMPAPPAPRPS